jgi:hypothetical protein
MNQRARALATLTLFSLLGCGGAATQGKTTQGDSPCGEARTVELRDEVSTGGVFSRLRTAQDAELTFSCPSDQPCSLPTDRRIEVTVEPERAIACEFAACRVPYLSTLPIGRADPDDQCPKVLWSVATVRLKSNAGSLAETSQGVNVLASPDGEGFLRFMVESPRALGAAQPGAPRSLLLDVQLEIQGDRVRGRMSALAAPLPSEPASELRFEAIWTATWESTSQRRGVTVRN